MFDFRDFTSKEKKDIEAKKKEIQQATEKTRARLTECLVSDTFARYREELEVCHKALISLGVKIMKETRNKDERLALYDMLFARAEILSLLLADIEEDRKKL